MIFVLHAKKIIRKKKKKELLSELNKSVLKVGTLMVFWRSQDS